LDIADKVQNFTNIQKIQLGIFRNDYMIDKIKKFVYQIEINTIASSMGFFSDSIKNFINISQKNIQNIIINI
jgi:hypothetical protein